MTTRYCGQRWMLADYSWALAARDHSWRLGSMQYSMGLPTGVVAASLLYVRPPVRNHP